jgi:hypothetical protein
MDRNNPTQHDLTPSLFSLGVDARFPNVNQTKHCWQNYVDYHKCIIAKGEDFAPCRQVSPPALPALTTGAVMKGGDRIGVLHVDGC